MKKLNALLAIAAFGLSAAAGAAAKVGAPAPDFSVTDSSGKTHALSQYRGKHVVLEWTNHDCPFVVKHYKSGNMQALQKQAAVRDVVWLTVISSAPGKQGHVDSAKADELTAGRNAVPAAVLFDPDGKVGRLYGAKTTPHMYIVDPEGTLVYMGGIDSIPTADQADIPKATPYVKVALEEVLAGKPVSNPVTRPYGCSVKY